MSRPIQTAMPVDATRYMPLSMVGEKLKLLQASGAVDYVHFWDQMMGWWPRHLWTPQNSPLAQFAGDIDSQPDAFALAAYGLAVAPEMGVSVSTDAIRRGPAEMMQTLLTLANLGERPPVFQLGAGELRNVKPYGWRRPEGLRRLEDHLRFYDAYRNSDEPIDLDGHFWTFRNAWIGRGGNPRDIRIWGLGGGPRLLDLTSSFADGITSLTPGVWSTPERTAQEVSSFKERLVAKDRDPDAFDFALWGACLMHPDEEVVERACQNRTVRWLAAMVGRFTQADWLAEGCEPPMGEDWHYATKLLPLEFSPAETDAILERMPADMVRKAFLCGTPEQVAARLQEHVDAGITWVEVADMLPFVLDPQEAVAAVEHSIAVCRALKGSRGTRRALRGAAVPR